MTQRNSTTLQIGNIFLLLFTVALFIQHASAQTVLAGLTSNGGPEGKGTAFTINTNGSGFSLIQGFADWGSKPTGGLMKGDDGKFYGTTSTGGTYGYGSIFSISPSGAVTILKQFNFSTDGGYPEGELTKGPDGYLYGVAPGGGANSYGTIYKISISGDFKVIRSFAIATDGSNPHGHLTLASDGNFYGMTYGGGANGAGTIFKLTPSGSFSVIHSMNKPTEGSNSFSSVTEGKDGNLYGLTYYGGTYGYGTVFRIGKNGSGFTVLKQLNTPDGTNPQSDLIQGTDGNLYGTCYGGGSSGVGTIFKITPAGSYTVIKNLSYSATGGNPYGALMLNTDGNFYGMTSYGGANSGGTIFKLTQGGVYSVIHSLQPTTEGSTPFGALVRGNDGNLYALASLGGTYNIGTAFRVTTAGAVTTLISFNGATKGNVPLGTMAKGKDSAYYFTTSTGGAYGAGTIVKICGGNASILFSFNKYVTGGTPKGRLLLANDGNLYGTASEGGTNSGGVIFKITPTGTYTVLRHLSSKTDGAAPMGGLIQATDGFLYGTNSGGGTNGNGTIFKISLSGTYTVLKHLAYATDGSSPQGDLVQASDGNLYGIANGGGRIFKLTLSGTYTILHTFAGNEGSNALGGLIQAKDGNLYGTCSDGGAYSSGTIFQVTTGGAYKIIKALNATPDGRMPKGNLLLGPDGAMYGMNYMGGTYNTGTVFKITTGGSYTVLRHLNIATDGGNPYGSLIFAPVNNYVANAQSVTTNQGQAVAVTLGGSGGTSLTYSIYSQPKNGTLSGTGASRTYTPNSGYSGKDSFYFTVSTGCVTSAPAKVSITIKAVNHAPVLDSIPAKTVIINNTLQFTATASDVDAGQIKNFSLTSAPSGATINATTGAFSWKPTATGTYTATIRVTDNGSPAMYDQQALTIKVNASATGFTTATISNGAAMKAGNDKVFTVSLYPNPVHNICNLQLTAGAETINITVADARGGVVLNKQLYLKGASSTSLDVATLTPGMYFLTVQTADNRQTVKFIKQ